MKFTAFRILMMSAVVVLPACSLTDDVLWPSLTGGDPAEAAVKSSPTETAQTSENAPSNPSISSQSKNSQPPLGTGNFEPTGVTTGTDTGTFVGKKVSELRGELERLQTNISSQNGELQKLRAQLVGNSQRYHGTIAAVNARLQVGTTPGNPILVQQFKSAQSDLDSVAQDVAAMNGLQNSISNSATMSSYLIEAAKASFAISGAIDEDHLQLAILEDEVNRTDVLIDRLFKEVTNDVRRQTNYVSTERANLNLMSAGIKAGEIFGGSLLNVAMAGSAGGTQITAGAPVSTDGRRPLLVVRFDRNEVPYRQALYNTVSRVLEKRPEAVFDLVAVAPKSGGQARVALNSNKARRHAENILRALTEMGLPPARVALAAKTEATARTSEVHLYLR